jgi:hypothetical protein
MGDLLSLKKVIKKVISPILTFSSTNLGINNLFVEYYQVLCRDNSVLSCAAAYITITKHQSLEI